MNTQRYKLTGTDRNGKRFRYDSDNGAYLAAHNCWRGTLWERQEGGTWKRIKTWNN